MFGPLQLSVSAGAEPELRRRAHLRRRLRPLDRQGARAAHDARRALDLRSERRTASTSASRARGRCSTTRAGSARRSRAASTGPTATTRPTTSTASSAGTRSLFDDVGDTGFGVDYTWTENVSAGGDQGQSVGLAAVQVLDATACSSTPSSAGTRSTAARVPASTNLPRHRRLAGALLMRGRNARRAARIDARRLRDGARPRRDEKPVSYNRRELPPSTGSLQRTRRNLDGVSQRRGARARRPRPADDQAPPSPRRPKRREILMCDRSRNCEQPESRALTGV